MIYSDAQYFSSKKIISAEHAASLIEKLKTEQKTSGLCHGGFDLLHPGHIKHFETARSLCDYLFVSITSDHYISLIKGPGRPIMGELLRAYAIASLESVGNVLITDSETAEGLIRQIKPSFYFKDDEFKDTIDLAFPEKINYRLYPEVRAVRDVGGDIRFTSEPKLSTTEIINYIKNLR